MKEVFRMENRENMTEIEYINIWGLFDRYNVKLPFEKVANIYIGENGMGKTTILNCIYFLLEKKFTRLAEINFREIELKFFAEKKSHQITKYDLNEYLQKKNPIPRRYYEDEIIEHYIEDMLENMNENIFIHQGFYKEDKIERTVRQISRMLDVPIPYARRRVYEYIDIKKYKDMRRGNGEKVKKLVNSINKYITQKILYLPTYRRIEDDFSKLNISADKVRESDMLIRFGMSDVQKSKEEILDNIRKEAIEGFNKMTGVLLKQYANSQKINRYASPIRSIDTNTVKLILGRIGDKIDDEDKAEIIELINSKQIYNGEYELLIDLLEKLIVSYESQKKYDDRIKLFADTCNKYLNGKKFYYNPSELSLEIYLQSEDGLNEERVELPYLSSGEKQIVSLFSKLYLENDKESIVIIDEPELSLSIKWQSMLLPDIMRSGNCRLLLTVTHSPFIFENEFDDDAREMRKYTTVTNGE